jgi:hypothetical protein
LPKGRDFTPCFTFGALFGIAHAYLLNVVDQEGVPLNSTVNTVAQPAFVCASFLGKAVQIMGGPLIGMQGVCLESRQMARSVVSIETDGRILNVELDNDWLGLVTNADSGEAAFHQSGFTR